MCDLLDAAARPRLVDLPEVLGWPDVVAATTAVPPARRCIDRDRAMAQEAS